MQNKEGVKGCYWFLESDLKDGTALKLDKTGKSILTIMRHLGRLQEVRESNRGHSFLAPASFRPPACNAAKPCMLPSAAAMLHGA